MERLRNPKPGDEPTSRQGVVMMANPLGKRLLSSKILVIWI
jgi:hypothetical protein